MDKTIAIAIIVILVSTFMKMKGFINWTWGNEAIENRLKNISTIKNHLLVKYNKLKKKITLYNYKKIFKTSRK